MTSRMFERDEPVHVEDVPCELGLLGDNLEPLPLDRQASVVSWNTDWSVRIQQERSFDLTSHDVEACYVGIYVRGHVLFALPIIGAPVFAGNLIVA
jgi:hypothetical protein